MRRMIVCLVFLMAFSVTELYAHGPGGAGHGPRTEITESEASAKATQLVTAIVEQGKLDVSWAQVQPEEVQKKSFKDRFEWVITFNNPGAKDPAKQKLYVFLSLYGDYLGANHTGS